MSSVKEFADKLWGKSFIDDLRSENEQLRETNFEHLKINGALRHNEEVLHNKNVELQQRIDKAIGLIERHTTSFGDLILEKQLRNYLVDALKGVRDI